VTWSVASTLSGAVGGQYVETPGPQDTNGDWTNACEVSYRVDFTTTGNYIIWLRRYATSGARNSVFAGVDGVAVTGVDNTTSYNAWVWVKLTGTVNVGSAGLHTVQVRRREAEYKADRIILTTDSGFTPSGNGPAESNRAFQESGGQVVMEGEHFTGSAPRTDPNGVNWQVATSVAGFVDGGYVETPGPQGTNGAWTNACEVSYRVDFTTTGSYVVWVRGYATGGSANSVFGGVDGVQASAYANPTTFNSWVWASCGTVSVSGTGVHTVQVRRREAVFKVDRVLLTTNTGFTPTGNGPPESP
jgi:hypothetical protein